MFWTLLVLLTVGWLLALIAGLGAPLNWLLPGAIAAMLAWRIASIVIGE